MTVPAVVPLQRVGAHRTRGVLSIQRHVEVHGALCAGVLSKNLPASGTARSPAPLDRAPELLQPTLFKAGRAAGGYLQGDYGAH